MEQKDRLLKNKSRQWTEFAGCGIPAYLSTRSISHVMDLRGGTAFSWSGFTLLILVGLWGLYYVTWRRWTQEKQQDAGDSRIRRLRFAGVLSAFFGIQMAAGYQLQWLGYTEPGFLGKARLLMNGLLIGLSLYPFLDRGAVWLSELTAMQAMQEPGKKAETNGKPWQCRWIFLTCFLGIWLCWIPVWLAYYPVIMSYDFHMQSLNALLGPQYFDAHHPLAHTWLIYVFRNLGEKIGSYETAFGYFSLLQQGVSALVLGYACVVIWRLLHNKLAVVAAAVFWGLFPLISVMVMCTSKDVLFGAFFMLFVLLWTEFTLFEKHGRGRGLQILGLLGSGVLMMLFRNNAWYAMFPFAAVCTIFCGRKKRIKVLGLILLLILLGKGALVGIMDILGSYKGCEIEKYSVIFQSMARVGNRQRDNLSAEEFALIDLYVGEPCWDSYNPPLADTIKGHVKQDNFYDRGSWNDMGAVLAAWVKIGLHYPNDYLDAFLDLTRGYWFWDDVSHAEMLGVGTEERMGLLYTYNTAAEESLPGMQHISKFPWLEERLEQIVSANCYTSWPIFSNLFKPAFWCWLLVTAEVWFWYRRDRKKAGILFYPLCYFGTMLLGPTAIIRYVYPFILLAPVMIALIAGKCDGETIRK